MAPPSTHDANQSEQPSPPDENNEVPFFDPYEEDLMDDSNSDGGVTEPFKDMEFIDIGEAYEFYNGYACRSGFSVRKDSHYVSTLTNLMTYVKYVCSKEGLPKKPNYEQGQNTPEKNRASTRCGCKAAMCIKYLKKSDKWIVSKFHKDHNHELIVSPTKKRLLQSQKYMTKEQKDLIKLLGSHGVKPSQILEILAEKAGGRHNLYFSRKDVSNLANSENRNLIGVDMDSTIMYFRELQQNDPEFFFAIDTDVDNKAKNIFWVNGRSRRSYREFGDVIIFDTTYATNKYTMPCAPFVGVNHHRQSILFGCALIRDEKMSTFEWLFEIWLKAMYGKHPQAIITDQDPAMKGAIAKLFPNTAHRCCQWHIMRKAKDRLGVLYGQIMGFQTDLSECINQSLTVEAFETKWKQMLHTYKLENNRHLKLMFSTASQWIPAYFKDIFLADMSTSQRSESMNAAMKMWFGSHTSIFNFVIQFEKITRGIFDKESEEDLRTTNQIHSLWSDDQLEEQARDVYTRNVFMIFKDNLKRASGYNIEMLENDKLYLVKSQKYRTSYKVCVDRSNMKVECECKGFERVGLFCSHALKVMQSIGMNTLPSHYILKRWTRDTNKDAKKPSCGESAEMGDFVLSARRSAVLTEKFNKLRSNASKNHDAYMIACAKLDELLDEIGDGEEVPITTNVVYCETHETTNQQSVCDPPVSQCKGKRKPFRFKPSSETFKKQRTCSICKKKAGHNATTCPKKSKLPLDEDGSDDFGSDGDDISN